MNSPDAASSLSINIRRQLAYMQSVVSSMPQGISVFDEGLRLRVWNQGFIKVLSLPDEVVREGVHFSDLIRIPAQRGEYGPGDIEEHVSRITALAMKFEAHCFERTRPNGHTHLVQGEPLFIDGKLAGFITTYTDITERKEIEVALRMQHNQLETVIESIPSAVSLFNKDERLVLYNDEFLRLLNIPETLAAPGCTLETLYRFNAERGEYGPGNPEKIVLALLERARTPTPHSENRSAALMADRESYERTLTRFKDGDLEGARQGFAEFLLQHPHSDLAPNARFWLGESYYGKKDFSRAIDAYDQVQLNHPASEKVPAALLKKGYAYLALKDRKKAASALKQVIDLYPRSPEANKAMDKLNQLKELH